MGVKRVDTRVTEGLREGVSVKELQGSLVRSKQLDWSRGHNGRGKVDEGRGCTYSGE